MPSLDGILETSIYVDDMERAKRFYEKVMGLKPMFADSRLTA
ncbi:MAG: VOC family protein, partial [Chitinivibrionia bacterium]|nr:VOC family protein [Chitinivibrionia bacterium]